MYTMSKLLVLQSRLSKNIFLYSIVLVSLNTFTIDTVKLYVV